MDNDMNANMKDNIKRATQITVFKNVDTENGAISLNRFLRTNEIINVSTDVNNGSVTAIVAYVVNVAVGESNTLQIDASKTHMVADTIELPRRIDNVNNGNTQNKCTCEHNKAIENYEELCNAIDSYGYKDSGRRL